MKLPTEEELYQAMLALAKAPKELRRYRLEMLARLKDGELWPRIAMSIFGSELGVKPERIFSGSEEEASEAIDELLDMLKDNPLAVKTSIVAFAVGLLMATKIAETNHASETTGIEEELIRVENMGERSSGGWK